jgi:hypothetical protein
MGNYKGIWNEKQEKFLAKVLDKIYKGKGILELIDGYLAKVIVSLVDDNALDKLPKDLKPKLTELTDLAIAEDIEGCEKLGAEILNKRIDIPGLEEDTEYVLFEGALTMVVGAIINWVRKKKSK